MWSLFCCTLPPGNGLEHISTFRVSGLVIRGELLVNYEPSRYSGSVSAIRTLMFDRTLAQSQTCAAIASCTPFDPVMTSLSCGSRHIARDSQLFGAMKLMTKDDIERDRCRVICKCIDNILLQNTFRGFFLETTSSTIRKHVRIKTWRLVHTMCSMYSLKDHFTCRKKYDFVPNTILQTNDHRRVTSASLLRSWSARQKSRMPPKVKVPEPPGRSRAIRT